MCGQGLFCFEVRGKAALASNQYGSEAISPIAVRVVPAQQGGCSRCAGTPSPAGHVLKSLAPPACPPCSYDVLRHDVHHAPDADGEAGAGRTLRRKKKYQVGALPLPPPAALPDLPVWAGPCVHCGGHCVNQVQARAFRLLRCPYCPLSAYHAHLQAVCKAASMHHFFSAAFQPLQIMPTPLTRLRWWRVCLDEAQMVESSTARAAQMALKLQTVHRW